MTALNVDDFFADAARTILTLYRAFPRPIELYVEDICGPDEPDEYGLHGPRHQACFAAILWLAEEGYIRYDDTIRQEAVDQAVLSGRCFAALHATAPEATPSDAAPPSVRQRQSTVVFLLEQAVQRKSSIEIEAAFMPLLRALASHPP